MTMNEDMRQQQWGSPPPPSQPVKRTHSDEHVKETTVEKKRGTPWGLLLLLIAGLVFAFVVFPLPWALNYPSEFGIYPGTRNSATDGNPDGSPKPGLGGGLAGALGQSNGGQSTPRTNQDPVPASTTPDTNDQTECPTQEQASQIIAGNDTALVKEPSETCLFEFRAPLAIDLQTWCPEAGFVNPRSNVESPWKWDCELDPSPNDSHGNQGIVFQGGNEMVMIDAGSFRPITAYPMGDPVRVACDSLANHRQNLIDNPPADLNFWQWPGNFDCDESTQPQQPEDHSNPCPDTKNAVVKALGGDTKANQWRRFNDGQWVRTSDTAADLDAPFGTLDWWDGHKSHMGTKHANDAFAATWNCLATQ